MNATVPLAAAVGWGILIYASALLEAVISGALGPMQVSMIMPVTMYGSPKVRVAIGVGVGVGVGVRVRARVRVSAD